MSASMDKTNDKDRNSHYSNLNKGNDSRKGSSKPKEVADSTEN